MTITIRIIIIIITNYLLLGCFLICDYGYDDLNVNESKDTFRAFRDLRLWDPLKEPGTAELTADVNFSYLKRSLQSKGIVFGSVPQAHFLKNLGVELKLYVSVFISNKFIIN